MSQFSISSLQNPESLIFSSMKNNFNQSVCETKGTTADSPFVNACGDGNWFTSDASGGNLGGHICFKDIPTNANINAIMDGKVAGDSSITITPSTSPSDPTYKQFMNSWFVSGGQLATCGFGGQFISPSGGTISGWNENRNLPKGNQTCVPGKSGNSVLGCSTSYANVVNSDITNKDSTCNDDDCNFGINPQNLCKTFVNNSGSEQSGRLIPMTAKTSGCTPYCVGAPTCESLTDTASCREHPMCTWRQSCVDTTWQHGSQNQSDKSVQPTYTNLFNTYQCGTIVPGGFTSAAAPTADIMPSWAFSQTASPTMPPNHAYHPAESAGCELFITDSAPYNAPTWNAASSLETFIQKIIDEGTTSKQAGKISPEAKKFLDDNPNNDNAFKNMFYQYYNKPPSAPAKCTSPTLTPGTAASILTSPSCIDTKTTLYEACANKVAADMEILPTQCAALIDTWNIVPINCNSANLKHQYCNATGQGAGCGETFPLCPDKSALGTIENSLKQAGASMGDAFNNVQYTTYFPPSVPDKIITLWNQYKCGPYVPPTPPTYRQNPYNSPTISTKYVKAITNNIIDGRYESLSYDCSNLINFSSSIGGNKSLPDVTWNTSPAQKFPGGSKRQCMAISKLQNLNKMMPNSCGFLFQPAGTPTSISALPCGGVYTTPSQPISPSGCLEWNCPSPDKPHKESMTIRWVIIGIAIALIIGIIGYFFWSEHKKNKVAVAKQFL